MSQRMPRVRIAVLVGLIVLAVAIIVLLLPVLWAAPGHSVVTAGPISSPVTHP
jgi:hypothetical protein